MNTKRVSMSVATLLILCLLSSSGRATVNSEEIVGIWLFDGGGGEVAKDSSGNGHDGTLNGPQWIAAGQFNGALEFNGSGNYIEFATGQDMKTPHFTIMSWFSTRKLNGYGHIFQTGNDWNDMAGYVFRVHQSGTAQSGLAFGPGNTTTFVTGPALQADTWYHMALTYDGTTAVLYLDGVNVASNPGNGDGEIMYDDMPVRIGVLSNSTGSAFDGFIDEVALFDVALEADDIQKLMQEGLETIVGGSVVAFDSKPGNAETDVLRDSALSWSPGKFAATHNVYFGTVRDDVNDASVDNPLGVLTSERQTGLSLDPGRLDFSQTYYWRVDEVNGAPDFTVFEGGVWSFAVEPIAVQISDVTASSDSVFGTSVPENTVNGSGLTGDLHGTSASDMWITAGVPATIQFDFDRVYRLHEMLVWNSNQLIESFVGFGAKDVVIEHSLDGAAWTVLEGPSQLAQAPGTEGYVANNQVDFTGVAANSVRITINSVHGFSPQGSLSEVRFMAIPTLASEPNPEIGESDVRPDVTVSWDRNGREADTHDIYMGSSADTLESVGNTSSSSFDTRNLDLQIGRTYYWRVDEVNAAVEPSIWVGDIWRFTTVDTIVIDDMELYADEELLEIWATWIDGFDDPSNGSLVGNGASGTPETGIVYNGSQSLPFHYDNSGVPLSEATRTFDTAMDWTRNGVETLVLNFQGSDTNTGGNLYVRINDTKISYTGNASLQLPEWNQWQISFADVVGANLTSVQSLTVGIDGSGSGVIYIDDVFLTSAQAN